MYSKYICNIVIYCIFVTSLSNCQYVEVKKMEPLYNISKETFKNDNVNEAETVKLERCYINNVHENSFENMAMLRYLQLPHNSIDNLPNNIFLNLKSLYWLELNNNQIHSLDSNIFQNNINLEILYLNGNYLEELPEDIFSNIKLLKKLWLSENKIKKIYSSTFVNNAMITHLMMDNNFIEDIPINLFSNLRSLKELNIYRNKIKILDSNMFQNCTSLDSLDFSDNLIEIIPNNFFSNSMTSYVDLSNNNISYIEKHVFPVSVHVLYLENNKLRYIDIDIRNMPNLRYLTLNNNPWKCDKKLINLLKEYKKLKEMQFKMMPECSQPRKLANRTWDTIDEQDLADSAPSLTVFPKDHKSEIGNSVVFSCRIVSRFDVNVANVNWKFQSKANNTISLTNSEKYIIHSEENEETAWYNVTLNKVQIEDDGKYICVYERDDDFVEEEIHFSVYETKIRAGLLEEKPNLSMLYESSVNATVSENVKLPCLVTGQSEEDMFWTFQNKIISNNGGSLNDHLYRVQPSQARNDAVWYNLTIFNVTSDNNGIYKCESNKKLIFYNIPIVYSNINVFHLFVNN